MSQIVSVSAPSIPAGAALEAEFRRLGFIPGFPAHVSPMARAVDQQAARRMKCPKCRRRGLGCKPYHKDSSYRVLTVCPACGAAGDEI